MGAHVVVVELDDMLEREREEHRSTLLSVATLNPPELTKICSIGFSDNYIVASAEFRCV